MTADLNREKFNLHLSQWRVVLYVVAFLGQEGSQSLVYHIAVFPIPPAVEKTNGEKEPCSISLTRSSYALFFSCSFLHQLKMASPAEVSKRRSNFRIRQFKEKRHYNIAANLMFNTMVSFVTLLIVRTARIACADRHTNTYIHTHTQDDYCNPLCACAPRVNKRQPHHISLNSADIFSLLIGRYRNNFRELLLMNTDNNLP